MVAAAWKNPSGSAAAQETRHQQGTLETTPTASPRVDAGESSAAAAAKQILQSAGVEGGLVVHLGCGDGRLTAALRVDERYLVQGLDSDATDVEQAREYVRSLGIYGVVSVDRLAGPRLPYAENLVKLLVVEELGEVSMDEVMRVLTPGGVVMVRQGDEWKKSVKPYAEDTDDWTHYLHDASGNAVAADLQVGPPRHMRWTAEPVWGRSHEFNPSLNALVMADGRMYYIYDDGMIGLTDLRFPARWSLYARDAFSGKLLWKRPVPGWGYREWNTRGMWSAPLTLNRRMVTDGKRVFVTLGYQAPVSVLDAATGEPLRTIAGSLGTDEMVLADGVLLLCVRDELSVAQPPDSPPNRRLNPHEFTIGPPGLATIVAVDAVSGRELWRSGAQPVVVLTLAALDGRVCYSDRQEIVCLDLKTGRKRWSTPCRAPGGSRHSGGTLVMHEDVVLFTAAEGITALGAESGEKLWTGPKVSGPGITHPADLFVADGLVWGGDEPGMHSRQRTAVRREGRDPRTGQVRRAVEVAQLLSPLHHVRCYRSKATDRFLLLTKRGVEFLDLQGDQHMRNDWLRAMCHYGFVPAYGLLYVPPSHCFCYPGVRMNGFLALAARRPEAAGDGVRYSEGNETVRSEQRLEKGPAFGRVSAELAAVPVGLAHEEWPTYRHDPWRSGHTKTPVSTKLQRAWQVDLGGKLTPPVLAGGRLYLSEVDAHRVCCLDAAAGELQWSFTAGGRVDSPPTICTFAGSSPDEPAQRLVLFGCRDGWVYCLSADGELVWRFRAAPEDRRIVAGDQVESVWPVPGSVLVLDGVAYMAAGRSSFLDGGIHLYGLKPQTGEVLCRTKVEGPWPDVQSDVGRPFDMDGAKSDILVTDGTHLFMYQMVFDKKLGDVTPPRASTLGDRITGRHLIATGGFLQDVWFDRTYWSYSNRWPGFYFANDAPKAGQILVFDEETTYGLHVFTKRLRLSPVFNAGGEGYELFADDNDNEPVLAPNSIDREKGPGFSRAEPPKWSRQIRLRARALVLAGEKLFMAGPPDAVSRDDPYAAFDGRLGARLWVVAAAHGEKLADYPLDGQPAFDGLIAAGGRLYLVTTDGRLMCFAGE